MELLEALSQTFDHTTKVVAGVTDDQLANATPCREWDARALLAHMTGVVANMGRGARGDDLLPDMNAYAFGEDRGSQFRSEADRTLAAWTAHGLEGEVNIGAGPMPAMAGVSINLIDTATHSWDLARATGQDPDLPEDLAQVILGVAQGFVTDQIRSFAGFDPALEVAADASAITQLVAFLGRQP